MSTSALSSPTDDQYPDEVTYGALLAEMNSCLARSVGIYQRAGHLVRVVQSAAEPNAASLLPLSRSALRMELSRDHRLSEAPIPEWLVSAVHEQTSWPVPVLQAIVECPVLLRSGRILETPGYDRGSGLFYRPAPGLCLPCVADSPSRDDIELAKSHLHETVCDFPFERECHRSGWYAGVLSYLARWAYDGPTPLFLINKSAPGIGGSRLAEAAQLLCVGRKGTLYTVAADNRQEKKQLDPIALNGDLLIYIDNISENTPFGTGELDKALTQDVWDCSVKYKDRTFRAPLRAIWWATGNNVQYRRGVDTYRRTQLIRLVSMLERPQERADFRHPDLLDWVMKNRGQVLWAFLTLLRAFIAAGCPKHGLPPWGGFEGWSDMVRECLVFHGYADSHLGANHLVEVGRG